MRVVGLLLWVGTEVVFCANASRLRRHDDDIEMLEATSSAALVPEMETSVVDLESPLRIANVA